MEKLLKKILRKGKFWQKILKKVLRKGKYWHNQLRKAFWWIRWPQIMQYTWLVRHLSATILVSHDFWLQIFEQACFSFLHCCSKDLFYEIKELWLLNKYWPFLKQKSKTWQSIFA